MVSLLLSHTHNRREERQSIRRTISSSSYNVLEIVDEIAWKTKRTFEIRNETWRNKCILKQRPKPGARSSAGGRVNAITIRVWQQFINRLSRLVKLCSRFWKAADSYLWRGVAEKLNVMNYIQGWNSVMPLETRGNKTSQSYTFFGVPCFVE